MKPLMVLTLIAALALPSLADDAWPRFRGPDGTGLAPADDRIPSTWTETDLAWKTDLPGKGHASSIVWDGRVYTTAADDADTTGHIACLDAATGRPRWTRAFDLEKAGMHRQNSPAVATPCADAAGVYILWTGPKRIRLVALDHDGRDRWAADLGPFSSQHGPGTSPLAAGGLVILANDQRGESSVVALDAATGDVKWQTERKGGRTAYGTPAVRRLPGQGPELVLASDRNGLAGLDLASGTVAWQLPNVLPDRCVSSPVTAGERVLATCGVGGGGTHLVAARAAPGVEPTVLYTERGGRDVPYVPTPLVRKGLAFLWTDKGTVRCLRAETGEVVWTQDLGAKFYSSPVAVGDRLFAVSRRGIVFVVRAADTFELLGANPLGEGTHATPAISGGRIFFRTFSRVLAVGRQGPPDRPAVQAGNARRSLDDGARMTYSPWPWLPRGLKPVRMLGREDDVPTIPGSSTVERAAVNR